MEKTKSAINIFFRPGMGWSRVFRPGIGWSRVQSGGKDEECNKHMYFFSVRVGSARVQPGGKDRGGASMDRKMELLSLELTTTNWVGD